jgi:sarcosine oxidase
VAEQFDVAIVGLGLAGAGTAWAASRRGLSVLALEQFGPGHTRGSSHGSARIVRRGYSDGLYVSLTGHAFELWREVEHSSERALLRMLGGLDFGPRRGVAQMVDLFAEAGVPHELLPAAQAEQRWPGMRFEGDVVFHPQAGTMDAAACVTAMLDLARAAGAEVYFEAAVLRLEPNDDGVVLQLADGATAHARVAVVAAGSWVEPLLSGLVALPPITVTQQQVFHFPRRDPNASPWPSVIHESATRAYYHLAGGRDGGAGDNRKIGEHGAGRTTTADSRDGVVDPDSRERTIRYVSEWLPGLVPEPADETTCLYTETPSEDFLLDRTGPLIVCSPCSGHGAKFAPLIGELTADLVTGARGAVALPQRFRLAAHHLPATGAVSL